MIKNRKALEYTLYCSARSQKQIIIMDNDDLETPRTSSKIILKVGSLIVKCQLQETNHSKLKNCIFYKNKCTLFLGGGEVDQKFMFPPGAFLFTLKLLFFGTFPFSLLCLQNSWPQLSVLLFVSGWWKTNNFVSNHVCYHHVRRVLWMSLMNWQTREQDTWISIRALECGESQNMGWGCSWEVSTQLPI